MHEYVPDPVASRNSVVTCRDRLLDACSAADRGR